MRRLAVKELSKQAGLVIVLVIASTCAVGASDLKDFRLNGKVKTVKTEFLNHATNGPAYIEGSSEVTFNPEGNIAEEVSYGANGAFQFHITYEQEAERMLSKTKWNERNEPIEITTYKYFPDGHVQEVTTSGADGALQERVEHILQADGSGELRTFGSDGSLKSVEAYRKIGDGATTTSETSENGKVIAKEQIRRDRDGKIEFRNYRRLDNSKVIREFNQKGDHVLVISEMQPDGCRISQVTITDQNGLIIENSTETIYPKGRIYPEGKILSSKTRRKYDKHGDEIEHEGNYAGGKCTTRARSRYLHDSQGNWIKKEDWNEGCGMKPRLMTVQRRIISYY
jgi:hypothetical protein